MLVAIVIVLLLLLVLSSRGEREETLVVTPQEPLPEATESEFDSFWRRVEPYWNKIKEEARKHKVDPYLVLAVIWAESSGRKDAKRKEDGFYSYGLMQVTYGAARDVGFKGKEGDLMNPETNIECGIRYLAKMIKEFEDYDRPMLLGVAAYNAGPSNVRRWLRAGLAPSEFPNSNYIYRVDKYWRTVLRYAPGGT